jgi:hypothetical protein
MLAFKMLDRYEDGVAVKDEILYRWADQGLGRQQLSRVESADTANKS